jgi:TonB-linked SusC/RagA family outer membrane protein
MSQKITFIFLISCLLIFPVALQAQNISVKGKVTDQNGSPLPGATIKVQGTNTGTSTDAVGNFAIAAPSGAKLSITQLGMIPQTITVTSAGPFTIALTEDSQVLGEVVVVGYGTQKKSVVTGAISGVKAADLENQPINRIEQALQGRTSGLTIAATSGQPGAASTVRLRGFTSFGNNSNDKNNPLWVVDGVVVDNGGIGYLNQSDIESIEVLKDAASAAIYGARSASGVILVTTKKGKEGTVTFNYNGYYGTQSPAKKLDMLNASQYAMVRNQSFAAVPGNESKALPFPNPESFGSGTDWQSTIFNDNASKQNHEFSISGGNEKSTFYTSVGYNTLEGIVASPISKWNRTNVRLNSTHKIKPWFTIGENLGYSHVVNSGLGPVNREFGGPLSSAINLDPITPSIVTDPAVAGKAPYTTPDAVKDPNGNFYGIPPAGFQEMTNPLAYIQTRLGNYNWDHNIVGNAFAELEPLKGLRVRSTFGTKLAFYGNDGFTPLAYFSTSSRNSRSTFARSTSYSLAYNLENTVSYTRDFNKHNVTLLLGQGAYKDGYTRSVNTTFFDVPATDFRSASFRYKPIPANRTTDADDGTDHKVSSLFSRLQYNYDEKYLLTALIRRDGSSRFGTNHKFGYFPSVSVGWVPSKEDFFPSSDIVNFLKIRASYGVTGNDVIGDLQYEATIGSTARSYPFGYGPNGEVLSIGYSPNAAPNPDLKWEETTQTDIGIDATLLTNFTLTADWYKKRTTGILQVPPTPDYVGSGSPSANLGDMNNTGFEIELGYRKKIGELNFGISGNASWIKNEVTGLAPGVKFIETDAGAFQTLGNITRIEPGHIFNEFYGYENLGLFQTQAEIDSYKGPNGTVLQPSAKPGDIKFGNLDGNEVIDVNDRTYIGSPLPNLTYGLTLNLAYKNFDFTAFGSGVGGNMIFQGLRRLDIGTAANWQTKILNSWSPSNTGTSTPRLIEGDPNKNYSRFSSLYLEKGDYFRLRTLQLGYSLPKSVISKIKLQRLRVYVLSENLFTLTKYSGFDPELGVSPDAGGGGVYSIDRGAYPQARTFLFGLNIGF